MSFVVLLLLAQVTPTEGDGGVEAATCAPVQTGPLTEALLKKLGAHDDAMENYLDGHTITQHVTALELDSKGKVEHTTESVLEIGRVKGKLRTKVVSSTKDAKDDRPDAEERAKKRDDENKRSESPFAMRNHGKYAYAVLGADPANACHWRVAFKPKKDAAVDIMIGEAIVDPTAGEVVRQSFKPSKYPSFVDTLDMDLVYGARSNGVRMLSKFNMSAGGGFLFIKRRGDVKVTFEYKN